MRREVLTRGIAGIKSVFKPKKIPEQLKNRLDELGLKGKRKGNTITFNVPKSHSIGNEEPRIPTTQRAGIVTYMKGTEELAKLKVGLFSEESIMRLLKVHKNMAEHLRILNAIKKKEEG